MNAPADQVWNLIAEIRNTPKYSPEAFHSEWLGGQLRTRRNIRDMTTTLNRIKAEVEAG